jgi:succinate dehydrogenase/fumarate reductase flavoprotein subunit
MTETTTVDVLVIGGGIAAAFAATRARESGATVALVDKSYFGTSGCSALASGTYPTYRTGDDKDKWLQNWSLPLTNDKLLMKFLTTSEELLLRMDEWGVPWVKEEGEIVRIIGPGKPWPTNAMITGGGPPLMMAIRRGVLNLGVSVFNRVMINDLLTSDGNHPTSENVIGAIGIDTRTGQVHVFTSKAVIMCTGPYKFPYPWPGGRVGGMPINLCGDGIAAVLRVGAQVSKTELGGIWAMPDEFLTAPGFEILIGQGAKLVNRLGERFMEKYDKERMERAPRILLYAATDREIAEGRGPVYMDIVHFSREQMQLIRSVIPIITCNFESAGYDLSKDRIPYTACPAAIDGVFACGAMISDDCETSLKGLFAAGGNSDVAYLHQGNLTTAAVTGYWAGESAAEYAKHEVHRKTSDQQVSELTATMLVPLSIQDGMSFDVVQSKLARMLLELGTVLDEQKIRSALGALDSIKSTDIARLSAGDFHMLGKILGLKNYVQVLEVVLNTYLLRRESRRALLRSDFPVTDNENWHKKIITRKNKEGSLEYRTEDFPETAMIKRRSRSKNRHIVFKERQT